MSSIKCPICSNPLLVQVAIGRKSNKPFIMLKCAIDGRHFRGFIADRQYVSRIFQEKAMKEKEK